MKKSKKKVKISRITERYSEEAIRFQGMFELWRANDSLISACDWLAAHVGRLRADVDALKKINKVKS